MHRTKVLPVILVFIVITIFPSCVKDIDFDQAGDISLQPAVQASLLIFEVEPRDFINPETNSQKQVIRDTVRLEFLDDSYIQNDLAKVEFRFKFRNTFPQSFSNRILFLSENKLLQHEVVFDTNPGSQGNTVISEKIEIIEPEMIQVIKRSIQMVVEITVNSNDQPFEGKLNFESTGLFYFQF